MFTAHDYKAPGREEFAWESTIGEQKARNVHVGNGQDMATFVQMREARDAKLGMPRLILPSVQVNMRGGEMPPAEENGQRHLKNPGQRLRQLSRVGAPLAGERCGGLAAEALQAAQRVLCPVGGDEQVVVVEASDWVHAHAQLRQRRITVAKAHRLQR